MKDMKVTVHTAKTTLSKLIERAHAGEEVIIARGKVPVARLVPISQAAAPRRKPGTLRGTVTIGAAFFEPLPADELEAWQGKGPRGNKSIGDRGPCARMARRSERRTLSV